MAKKKISVLIACLLLPSLLLAAQVSLITFNSTWRYLDNGSDQGTAWYAASFNDTGWKSGVGKFGYGIPDAATVVNYGDDASKKYITTYFRKSISIDNAGEISFYQAQINRDDGVVVYVNGKEVYRNNMPTGTITYTTKASGTTGGDDGATPIPFTIPASAFVSGTNVLAVEIHQASQSSSDIAFDMELIGETSTEPTDQTPPEVTAINRQNPSSEFTTATTITFRATFSEQVTGVDATDFSAETLTGTVKGNVTATVAVGAAGDTYDVSVALSGTGALRLNLKSSGTAIQDIAGNIIERGFTSGQSYTIEQESTEPVSEGFKSITPLSKVPISANTGEKPQSKVWKYDGKHWAVLPNSTGTYLWRLDGTTWTNVLRLSTKTTSKADCKLDGNAAHIFLFQGRSSQMVSIEYVPESGTYKLWSKRTATVGFSFESGIETATIEIDGNGRMWMAADGESSINVRWSDAPYNTWSSPITIANVSKDDICAIIALPGKVGILWSDQNTKRFGFKTHTDGAAPTDWSATELPASQSALNLGLGMADDHLNMAVSSDGTLYCAVKTGYDTKGYVQVALLVRRPSGSWDDLYEVAAVGTRPIVVLNEKEDKIRVIYTAGDYGGNILYRESSFSSIAFKSELILISGGTYNNATSTKANFTDDIVILASSSSEAVGVLAKDVSSVAVVPKAPTLVSPGNLSTDIPVSTSLSWNASVDATAYQAQLSTSSGFSKNVFDDSNITGTSVSVTGLSGNTTYYWRVRAYNSAGTSAWSPVWSFTTTSDSTPPPVDALVGHWKMDEGSGTVLLDASGAGNNAETIENPSWVTGREGLALRLSGSGQYATVPDNVSLDITGAITLAAWIKPEQQNTQYVIKKAVYGSADGYELSLASSGKIFFRYNQDSKGDTYRLNSVANYPSDGTTWMHVAATFDGTVLRLYVNGVENASKTLSSPPAIGANGLPLAIGAQSNGVYKFKGAIDDARVYSKALTASEISALASSANVLETASTSSIVAASGITANELELAAYPNPFSSVATLHFVLPEEGEYSVILYDSKGSSLSLLQQGRAQAGEARIVEVDGANLAGGLYFVRLQTTKEGKTLRLILNK